MWCYRCRMFRREGGGRGGIEGVTCSTCIMSARTLRAVYTAHTHDGGISSITPSWGGGGVAHLK